jgi:hypothetical protein
MMVVIVEVDFIMALVGLALKLEARYEEANGIVVLIQCNFDTRTAKKNG